MLRVHGTLPNTKWAPCLFSDVSVYLLVLLMPFTCSAGWCFFGTEPLRSLHLACVKMAARVPWFAASGASAPGRFGGARRHAAGDSRCLLAPKGRWDDVEMQVHKGREPHGI